MIIATLANRQNDLKAGRLVVAPNAKARAFVSDVIVIAGPEWPSAEIIRSSVACLRSV